ncbi:MAG: phage portal protein [Pseudomonadota bacterium]
MAWPWPLSLITRTTAAPVRQRSFDAATGDRRGKGMGMFGPINGEVGAGLELTRRRARYLEANNPWCTNGVSVWCSHLTGSGIRPTAKTNSIDERQIVSAEFETWADDPANFGGMANFWGLQEQVARHLVRDGEALAAIEMSLNGFGIRLIAPDQLDQAKTANLGDGRLIVQGVEFDARGNRVAYWIFPDAPHSEFTQFAVSERYAATDILHIFKPMSAGQVRGVSWLAPVVLTTHELDQLSDALLVGAKTSAMLAGFLTDINNTSTETVFDFDDEGAVSLEPGTIQALPAGVDIKFSAPDAAKDAPAFVRLNLQAIAAGMGLPEHLLSGDLTNANYSSIRAGLLPFRQRVEQVQYHTLVPQFLLPIWRRWLAFQITSGRMDISADLDVEWIMPRHLQVDPSKDVDAVTKMLDAGLMSRTQAVAELGWSIDDLDAEIAQDREREARLGLNFNQSEGAPNAA